MALTALRDLLALSDLSRVGVRVQREPLYQRKVPRGDASVILSVSMETSATASEKPGFLIAEALGARRGDLDLTNSCVESD